MELDTKKRILKERTIYLFDAVSSESMKVIVEQINNINILDRLNEAEFIKYKAKPIKLFINTYGGDLYAALALTAIMLRSETPVHIYSTGASMSAGFIIHLAGKKRFAYTNVRFMYHELGSGAWGKLTELIDNTKELKILQKEVDNFILERTSIAKSKLDKIRAKKDDWFIVAKKAKKLGIIHEIL